MKLFVYFPAIFYENEQENQQDTVDEYSYGPTVQSPHKEERTQVEKEKLQYEECKALSGFKLHIFDC